ncbi:MAG: hypothetical protein FJ276_12890 [Planctomycetes bacterium]|nr:hypothetical protein [Planctomycetota bacterium]
MSSELCRDERRFLELLADRAAFGLRQSEEQELRALTERVPGGDAECMERSAAVVQLAGVAIYPLPRSLRDRLRDTGRRCVVSLQGGLFGEE